MSGPERVISDGIRKPAQAQAQASAPALAYTSIIFKKTISFSPTPGTYDYSSPSHGLLANVLIQNQKIVEQRDHSKPWCLLSLNDNFKYWYQKAIPAGESIAVLGLMFRGGAFLGERTDTATGYSGSLSCLDGNLNEIPLTSDTAKKTYVKLTELK